MIFLIGDSHVQSLTGPHFKIVHLPSPTAYQNYKRIPTIEVELNSHKINKENDFLFFSFGEIDIRCHLGFISEKTSRTYEDVVSECIKRYETFLDHFINDGYKIGVWGVIPSGPNNGVQGNGSLSYKTKIERNMITNIFNNQLISLCGKKNIYFKSVYDKIIKDEINYDKYYSKDNIHLNAGMFKTHETDINCEQLTIDQFKDLICQ